MFFSKYQGAGNDFILIDDRSLAFFVDTSLIERLCDRRLGIGADGLILLQPSLKADFRMRIFNADGQEAAMCGNGLRCLIVFLQEELKIIQTRCRIETMAGILECFVQNGEVCTSLGNFKELCLGKQLQLGEEEVCVDLLHTGVPHAVVFVDDLENENVEGRGRALRFHPFFAPEGANVNFAQLKGGQQVAMRTYERGVEAETLSCGTGAGAVAIAAMRRYGLCSPVTILAASSEPLIVEVGAESATVAGPARFVFRGSTS